MCWRRRSHGQRATTPGIPPGTPPTATSVCSAGPSLMTATSSGITTGLTNTAGLNFRAATAARGIRFTIIGGGGAGGAIGNVPVWTTAHTGEAPGGEHLAMRTILCAVDASPASIGLMRSASGLSKKLGANLRLVHAVLAIEAWPDRNMDREFEETLRENARRTIQDLEKAADIEVPVCVVAGAAPDVVREEALQYKTDLIVIGRGALQGTLGRLRTHSYGIIRNAPCPVLSV
jgi:nucleotide-binding universal stress UspA family protein